MERAIVILGAAGVAFVVQLLRPGRPGMGLLEIAIIVGALAVFVLQAARTVDAADWSERRRSLGLALGAAFSLLWLFAVAELVGEIRSGERASFYVVFLGANALAFAGTLLALRWAFAGGVVVATGAVAGLAAAFLGTSGDVKPLPSLVQLLFAAPAVIVAVVLMSVPRGQREARPFGSWLRELAPIGAHSALREEPHVRERPTSAGG